MANVQPLGNDIRQDIEMRASITYLTLTPVTKYNVKYYVGCKSRDMGNFKELKCREVLLKLHPLQMIVGIQLNDDLNVLAMFEVLNFECIG